MGQIDRGQLAPPGPAASPAELADASRLGLYAPQLEHDACGVGFVAHIAGHKSHAIVEQGLKILENLDHRGAVGADPLMGDGAGILIQIPDEFYRADMADWPGRGELRNWQEDLRDWVEANDACRRAILARLEGSGPLVMRDLPDTCVKPWGSTGHRGVEIPNGSKSCRCANVEAGIPAVLATMPRSR